MIWRILSSSLIICSKKDRLGEIYFMDFSSHLRHNLLRSIAILLQAENTTTAAVCGKKVWSKSVFTHEFSSTCTLPSNRTITFSDFVNTVGSRGYAPSERISTTNYSMKLFDSAQSTAQKEVIFHLLRALIIWPRA